MNHQILLIGKALAERGDHCGIDFYGDEALGPFDQDCGERTLAGADLNNLLNRGAGNGLGNTLKNGRTAQKVLTKRLTQSR